ncbi:hypothetical protein RJT34_00691 [Clitoria ternatea]|uniref:Uncharacterized protein n=1 Tax=Clitoria ternatea TaxID=43366 RepID=A0AAN9KFK0_CLITE
MSLKSSSLHFPLKPITQKKKKFSVGALVTPTAQDVSDTALIGDEKIGVLLLKPWCSRDSRGLQPFLFNLFADSVIIQLPKIFNFLQKPLAQFVSVLRAPKSKEGYAAIGGGSPLRRMTDAQAWHFLLIFLYEIHFAEELRKSLWTKNVRAKVYVGMPYWHPFTEEATEQRSVTKIKASTERAASISTMQGEASHVTRQTRTNLLFPLNVLCRWWWNNCHMVEKPLPLC